MNYKYLLFGFDNYYPSGGMDDLVLKFNQLEEVVKYFKNVDIGIRSTYDYYQLVNTGNFEYKEFEAFSYSKGMEVPHNDLVKLIEKQIKS